MLERFNELLGATLLRQIRRLLQLAILLAESRVELRKLDFHIILDEFLLIAHNLKDLVFEFLLALNLQLLQLVKHGVHQRCQDAHVLGRHRLSLLDIVLDVPERLLEVVETVKRS